jgi:hypothetical protein
MAGSASRLALIERETRRSLGDGHQRMGRGGHRRRTSCHGHHAVARVSVTNRLRL